MENCLLYGNIPSPSLYEAGEPRAPQVLPITRSLFEVLLRRLVVKQLSNVEFLSGTVDGLQRSTEGSGKLTGVKVRTQEGEQFEPATLVVGELNL